MRQIVGIIIFTTGVAAAIALAASEAGVDADYLTKQERTLVAEINLARTQPKKYASFIEAWVSHYDGKVRKLPDRTPIRTKEGVAALRETITYLKRREPLHALQPRRGLSYGARDHVADMGPSGGTGHRGYDDSDSAERVNRYGRWQRKVAENIAYGSEDPREIIIRLIVDDGVKSRGHRANIFDADFGVVGVAFGYHHIFGTMSVITFAADYLEGDDAVD